MSLQQHGKCPACHCWGVHADGHEPCAGGIVSDDDGRLLLVLRAHRPSAGRWSIPGGRCLPGESSADACAREVYEETGLRVRVLRLAGRVEVAASPGLTYDIDDYVCALVDATRTGVLTAGDDAAEARWVSRAELNALPLVPGLVDALSGWDCLPR